MTKRYIVYYWTKSDIEAIEYDTNSCIEEFLDRNQTIVKDYGEKIGSFDTDLEAMKFSRDYKCTYYDCISIWDSKEHIWFN